MNIVMWMLVGGALGWAAFALLGIMLNTFK
jgi:hypothetical protein